MKIAKSAKCLDLHGACGFRDAHDDTMGTMTTRDIRTACNRWHRASRGGMSNQEVGENTFFIPRAVLSPTSWLLIPTPACGRRASV